MSNFDKIIDNLIENICNILMVLLLMMILMVFISIVFRYFFNISSASLQELIMYCHAIIFMFGISYTLKENGHVKIDIIFNTFSKKIQSYISIIGILLFIFPMAFFLIYISMGMVIQSWLILEGSSEAGGLNLVFILKTIIPLTGFLILLQSSSQLLKLIKGYKMGIEIFAIIFIVFTFIILLSGIPVAFVLSGSALLFSLIGIMFGVFDYSYLLAIPNRILGIMSNQNLLAVPLFIFMGLVLEKTKIAEELLMAMNILYKNTDGGFAISVVLVGVLMGASTGIVGASVVTLGLLSLPVMIKNNYPRPLACGVICASGTLGQIIPPSLVLILLADVLSSAYQQAQLNLGIFTPETVTISDLFAGALIPGLLLPVMFIFYIKSLKINNINKNITKDIGENINIISSFFPPILLIITVLGSIVLGIATPSEAASLGAIGSLLIAFAKNKLSFNVIRNTSKGTIKLTSMVFLILIGATFFSLVFRGFEGEELIQNLLSHGPENKYLSLIITLGIMFFLGFILDFIEIIFIIIPLFGPVLFSYGFDPIWVGILIAMVLQTSFLTPPFGFSLFYLRGVAPKEIPTKDIYKGVLPFIIIQIIAIGLVFMFPQIALFLPDLLN